MFGVMAFIVTQQSSAKLMTCGIEMTSANAIFIHRTATVDDVPNIRKLMGLSIEHNMRSFLSDDEIVAAKETMGVDMTLINDGTYFAIENHSEYATILVGCGGWGKRKTLYGGDHTKGRNDQLSDPNIEPARIRAMYTHPDWVRCGIGSLLLELGETAAKKAGFKRIELGSTVPGEPLYLAKGYVELSRNSEIAVNGSESVIIKMTKSL
ncbi:MAG: GNAT superfamily N-acetyltransferase [Alphaproteobacteria bacterium]|jgi:GNAT superfamily N-acetyltransferase